MNTTEDYLDSLEKENDINIKSASYIEETGEFCKKNKDRLKELPSIGQLEQLKLKNEPKELIRYIIHQSEKTTNKSWRTEVFYRENNKDKKASFFEFLIERIFSISHKGGNIEECKRFVEYLLDFLKMSRR